VASDPAERNGGATIQKKMKMTTAASRAPISGRVRMRCSRDGPAARSSRVGGGGAGVVTVELIARSRG
jgi:hypothetical protein